MNRIYPLLPYIAELLCLLSPLLIFQAIDPSQIIPIIKAIIFCLVSIYSLKFLIPLLYEKIEPKKQRKALQSIFYYISILLLAAAIVVTSKLLKESLPPLAFTFFLGVLFLTALDTKLKYEQRDLNIRTLITFFKFFLLIFVAFFIFAFPPSIPLVLFSFMLSLPATALTASQTFLQPHTKPTLSDRIPGMLLLLAVWLAGGMALIQLIHLGHFALFILLPWVLIVSPSKKDTLEKEDRERLYSYAQNIFLLFMLILILVRLLLSS